MTSAKLSRLELFDAFRSAVQTMKPSDRPNSFNLGEFYEERERRAAPVNRTLKTVPRVLASACLAYIGSFCSICKERCPSPGAIVVDEQGRPRVDAIQCTRCGVCIGVCPAPINGFELIEQNDA